MKQLKLFLLKLSSNYSQVHFYILFAINLEKNTNINRNFLYWKCGPYWLSKLISYRLVGSGSIPHTDIKVYNFPTISCSKNLCYELHSTYTWKHELQFEHIFSKCILCDFVYDGGTDVHLLQTETFAAKLLTFIMVPLSFNTING
jgi:hypothetical protein